MITCREFIEFLMDYLSGELPEDQRTRFDEHMAMCPSCVAYMKTYQETVRLGRKAFEADQGSIPESVPAELVEAILAARRRQP